MENKKPELSAALRGRLNELYRLLKTRRMSKAELMVHFNTGERQIRDMVALLAKKKPVVSVSSGKGYAVARRVHDYDDVRHAWQEIDSRIAELEERKKPLIDFCEKVREYEAGL